MSSDGRLGPPASASPPVSVRRGVAVVAEDVSKVYRLYDAPQDRLKEMFASRFGRRYSRDFWALRDVSFELPTGARLGLIGRNGSGKSTLLQILAGTLAPTAGRVQVNGRVAALLELGSGFNPDYTGRENIFVNASLLGLTRQQTEQRFDRIAAFADIGNFLDQPVKTYSSGMFMRLAFAVTTGVDADVLLVDEALAVGDVFFTQKCYRHLQRLVDTGVSVMLVSHDSTAITQFCESVIVLDSGRAVYAGDTVPGVRAYHALQRGDAGAPGIGATGPAAEEVPASVADWPADADFTVVRAERQEVSGARGLRVALCDMAGRACPVFEMGADALVFAEFELDQDVEVLSSGTEIVNERSIIVHGKNAIQTETATRGRIPRGTRVRMRHRIRLSVAPGTYTFNVGLATLPSTIHERVADLRYEELAAKIVPLVVLADAGTFTVVPRRSGQPLPWHGLCDLDGEITLVRETSRDA